MNMPLAARLAFLQDKASWVRPGGENGVWNLVDVLHNPPVIAVGNASLSILQLSTSNDTSIA